MGASKTYTNSIRWGGKVSNRGSEQKYTSTPAARVEGTLMSGEDDYGRKGSKGGGNASRTIAGPKRRKCHDSGY